MAYPRSSPWGAVQHCEQLREGIFQVSTAGHGGIMVRRNEAAFLSPEALINAIKERNYLCYEEDCDASIALREMLDKGLWEIPDRITDKAGYEENINRSLRQWNPEYWEARQKRFPGRDEMPDARREIVFRDERYKEKFRIKDGESIKITVAYDGEELVRKCRFINETHLTVGSSAFHIDELMERMKRVGNTCEPIPGQEPKIDIVIVQLGKPAREAEIPISRAAMREILGGEPEIVCKDKFTASLTGNGGGGTLIVCGINGGNLTSLHPYDAQKFRLELAERPAASASKKPPTLAERLDAGRAKAAAQTPTPREAKSRRAEAIE